MIWGRRVPVRGPFPQKQLAPSRVNELINSKCLIRLARQISVPTDKDQSNPLILSLKIKIATKVFMVYTL